MPRTAFGFDPAPGAARPVGRIEFLRDNALESHVARRGKHGLCVRHQMRDVADPAPQVAGGDQLFEANLAFSERQRAQVLSSLEQQIKRKENEIFGFFLR